MTAADVTAGYDLVVAAAWLPVNQDPLRWRDGAGNTARVLRATVAQRGGAWIATTTGRPRDPELLDGVWLHPVPLDPVAAEDYLHGHCAATLAPLYHDAGPAPRYRPRWGMAYRDVNQRVAIAVDRAAAPGATVWIHDYHLNWCPACFAAGGRTCVSASSCTARFPRRNGLPASRAVTSCFPACARRTWSASSTLWRRTTSPPPSTGSPARWYGRPPVCSPPRSM